MVSRFLKLLLYVYSVYRRFFTYIKNNIVLLNSKKIFSEKSRAQVIAYQTFV